MSTKQLLTKRQQEIWKFLAMTSDDHGGSTHGARDRRARRPRVPVHGARAPGEPGARRPDQARPTKPRALELSGRVQHEPEPSLNALPLVGQIAAGGPLLAEQNIDTYISVPEPLSRGGDEFSFASAATRWSTRILEGDFVVVRRQQDARDGDIVVALVGDDESADEATVKRSSATPAAFACNPRTRRMSRTTPRTSRSSAR